MQAKKSNLMISSLESASSELQERMCSLQTTISQLESDSVFADKRCFMLPDAYCPMLEVQHSGRLHCSGHKYLDVMEHHGTHMQTQPGGVITGVSVDLNVHNPCVLVDFAEAVIEPNIIKTQCGMAVPTVSLAMAPMHPLRVMSVCMVSWLAATAVLSPSCSWNTGLCR